MKKISPSSPSGFPFPVSAILPFNPPGLLASRFLPSSLSGCRSPLFVILAILLILSSFAGSARAVGTQSLDFDPDTGAAKFHDASAQFINLTPAQFRIGNTQLVATGKTVSFANSLAFAATSDGFTATVPATGTVAIGAGTNSVSSTNNTATGGHTHAITSSSNPGAAASLLASNSSGYLQLQRFLLGTSDSTTGFSGDAGVINPLSGNTFRSTSFTSGVRGWDVDDDGNAEFNNARVRGELSASVFKIGEITATAGTQGVFPSAAILASDALMASADGLPFNFIAENSDDGASLLAVNDVVRFKAWTSAPSPSSIVSDTWGTITARTNNGTTTTYTATKNFGSNSAVFKAGTAIVDYGPSGSGFITLSADGTVGPSPNMTMATHAGSPWSAQTNLLRVGNLNGSYGYATDVYGFGVGQYGAAQAWLTFDTTNGIRIGNNTTTISRWFANGDLMLGQEAAGQTNLFYTVAGGTLKFRNNATDVVRIGTADGFEVVNSTGQSLIQLDPAGNARLGQVATNKANIFWNASNNRLEFRGSTNGTAVQSYVDDDGSFVSGSGNVKLNSAGLLFVTSGGALVEANSVSWKDGSDNRTGILANSYSGTTTSGDLEARAVGIGGTATIRLLATNDIGVASSIKITRTPRNGSNNGYINIGSPSAWVAIGDVTVVPTAMLDVYGDAKIRGSNNANLVIEPSAASSTTLKLNTFNDNAANRNWAWRNRYNANGTIELMRGTTSTDDPTTAVMSFNNASALQLHALGAGTLTTDASGNVTATSDERMKLIKGTYTRGLADLRGLKPQKGHWDEKSGLDPTEEYVWLTAQDRLQHIPESVFLAPDGKTFSVHDGALHATYVNAFNEIADRLEAIESGTPKPPPEKDTTDRKRLAADRLTGLHARLQDRKAKEPKPLPSATPIDSPPATPNPTTTPAPSQAKTTTKPKS